MDGVFRTFLEVVVSLLVTVTRELEVSRVNFQCLSPQRPRKTEFQFLGLRMATW